MVNLKLYLCILIQAEWVELLVVCIILLTEHLRGHTVTYTTGSLAKQSFYAHTHTVMYTYITMHRTRGYRGKLLLAAGCMRHWLDAYNHVDNTNIHTDVMLLSRQTIEQLRPDVQLLRIVALMLRYAQIM